MTRPALSDPLVGTLPPMFRALPQPSPELRAKYLAGDHSSATPAPDAERTNSTRNQGSESNSVIDDEGASVAKAEQTEAPVHPPRELTVDESDFLDIIDANGGVASGARIAQELDCSRDAVKTLGHRLWKIGAVEITRRGYTRGSR